MEGHGRRVICKGKFNLLKTNELRFRAGDTWVTLFSEVSPTVTRCKSES
jgi:hypothetical protein